MPLIDGAVVFQPPQQTYTIQVEQLPPPNSIAAPPEGLTYDAVEYVHDVFNLLDDIRRPTPCSTK